MNAVGGYYGYRNVYSAQLQSYTFPSGQSFDALYTKYTWGDAVNDSKRFALPIKTGDRVYARARIGTHRCAAEVYAMIFDKNGSLIEARAASGGRNFGGVDGNPANFDVVGGVYTVAASGAAYLGFMVRMLGTGENNPYLFVTEPAYGVVPAGQTALPEYTTGPGDRVADQTSDNVSAGFAGQGAFATINNVDLDNASRVTLPYRMAAHPDHGVNYFDANRVAFTTASGGNSLQNLRPAEYGSNVTESRVASGIYGQAATATSSDFAVLTGSTKPEAYADVTVLMTPASAAAKINFTYDGTAKAGQLPASFSFKVVSAAGADVTGSSSWSATLISGAATFTIGSATGIVNVTAITADAMIEVKAIYAGKSRLGYLQLSKVMDAAPTGGAGGGTSASNSVGATGVPSSYSATVAPALTVKAGSSGQVALSANVDFYRNVNGTSAAYGKWQWRAIGGTYADVASEVMSSVSAVNQSTRSGYFVDDPINDPGNIVVNMTKTGLTAGVDYEFQLLLRSSTSYIDVGGTENGVGS